MIIRLDDASEKMNLENWSRIEKILDKYSNKPIVGIIPENKDPDFQQYPENEQFLTLVKNWEKKNWYIAMHGYNHIFETNDGGLNPVNKKSEFAGLDLDTQKKKIKDGYETLFNKGIRPKIFFAPAHTFDNNTIEALRQETDIRIISDTIANNIYFKDNFYYIPQQSGKCRNLPFKTITFCYHPNNMRKTDFDELDTFIQLNRKNFNDIVLKKRKRNLYDVFLAYLYLKKRRNK